MWLFNRFLGQASQSSTPPVPQGPAASINREERNEDAEIARALEESIKDYERKDTDQRAFDKLTSFLEFIGMHSSTIKALSAKFPNYAKECPITFGNLKRGKTTDKISAEYLSLTEAEQAKFRQHVQGFLEDKDLTFVNKIGSLIDFFGGSLKDSIAHISEKPSPVVPVVPVVAPVITPVAAEITLTPEQIRRIQKLETIISRRIKFDLNIPAEDIVEYVEKLQSDTNYENCKTFEEKMTSLAAQEKLISERVQKPKRTHDDVESEERKKKRPS